MKARDWNIIQRLANVAAPANTIAGSSGWRREAFGSAASKPAPFAEKKNAKDAAPAKSIRGAMEVRCKAED
jgi:hypothetical protein